MRRGRWAAGLVTAVILSALAACGGDSSAGTATIETISPAEASGLLEDPRAAPVVLDVRTPGEFAAGHLPGAINLDYQAAGFADDLAALNREVPYLLYCRTDSRSGRAREMMRNLGFVEVYEIDGGIVAWAEAGLAVVAP